MSIEHDLPLASYAAVEYARQKEAFLTYDSIVCYKSRMKPPKSVQDEVKRILSFDFDPNKRCADVWEEIEKYKRDHICCGKGGGDWEDVGKVRPKLFYKDFEPVEYANKWDRENKSRSMFKEWDSNRAKAKKLLYLMRGYEDVDAFDAKYNTPLSAQAHYELLLVYREPKCRLLKFRHRKYEPID